MIRFVVLLLLIGEEARARVRTAQRAYECWTNAVTGCVTDADR